MEWYCILLLLVGGLLVVGLSAMLFCYRMAFYSPPRTPRGEDEYPLPEGDIYLPYAETMVGWMKDMRSMPCEAFSISSHDGLTLRGKFFEYAPGAPIELLLHGYRGDAERDMCGSIPRCFALGHSAFIVEQRASGGSDGNTITFGVKEHRDCLAWVQFIVEHFGPDVKIILTGISMGAATVLLAAGQPLPPQVKGVLADCGYSSAPEMIRKTIREMKLPCLLAYPFVRLAGMLFGGFDIEEAIPLEAVKHSRVPIIFIHGEADDFVPCAMSREMHRHCASPTRLLTIPDAGHGLAYPKAPELYVRTLREFWDEHMN
ncbi:MAG: alpha/beta fold hydrolase [Clostridia bacterium]|nr:alpha/beta fold hydrolase [Clostridia bacterium]